MTSGTVPVTDVIAVAPFSSPTTLKTFLATGFTVTPVAVCASVARWPEALHIPVTICSGLGYNYSGRDERGRMVAWTKNLWFAWRIYLTADDVQRRILTGPFDPRDYRGAQ